jgi:hypothetical protein
MTAEKTSRYERGALASAATCTNSSSRKARGKHQNRKLDNPDLSALALNALRRVAFHNETSAWRNCITPASFMSPENCR